MAIRFAKWLSNIPQGLKSYRHFPIEGPPKNDQFGIFGLKIYHLATLLKRIKYFNPYISAYVKVQGRKTNM
jgi:hypothetical protein